MKDVRVSVCEKGRILGATFKGWMDGEEERREREREWERKRDKDTEWQNGGKKVRECMCLREREREIAYGLDLSCTRASFVPSVDQARKNWTEKESERERQRWDRQ